MIPKIIVYSSYLVFPFLMGCVWLWTKKWRRGFLFFLIVLSVLFIQARFIETHIVVSNVHEFAVNDASTSSIRAVVYGDMHIGVYRSPKKLQKDVDVINSLNPDIILMTGDFTEQGIKPEELEEAFSIYQDLNAPAYAVTGNHDSEHPGRIPVQFVRDALRANGVIVIDDQALDIEVRGQPIHLVGLSDIWSGETDYTLAAQITEDQNSIVVVHNPDALLNITNFPIDLVVAGHTHAGQVRIPIVYDYFIPTSYPFDHGWYRFGERVLFITVGTGVSGFPLRFLNPGAVDAIDMRF